MIISSTIIHRVPTWWSPSLFGFTGGFRCWISISLDWTWCPWLWPASSPDITPLDFFLWGYVKTKVYKHEITNIDDLKTKITDAVASVRPEMLVNTWNEVKIRLQMLRENGGRHVEGQILFFYWNMCKFCTAIKLLFLNKQVCYFINFKHRYFLKDKSKMLHSNFTC